MKLFRNRRWHDGHRQARVRRQLTDSWVMSNCRDELNLIAERHSAAHESAPADAGLRSGLFGG